MGKFYFTGQSVINEQLDKIADQTIYKRGENILPYLDNKPLLFVDFVPELNAGQTADIYLNGNLIDTVKVVNSEGLIYSNINLNYGENDVRVHVGSTEMVDANKGLREYRFTTKNYIIFIEILIIIFENIKAELEAIKNDTFSDSIRDSRLEEIFGSKLRFPQFNNLSDELYRDAIIGSNNGNKPGLRGSLFSQSTEDAIIKLIQSIFGSTPTFDTYYAFNGWKLYGSRKYQLSNPAGFYHPILNPLVDTDPGVEHYHIENDTFERKCVLDYHNHKKGSLRITIPDSDIEVISEAVIKSPTGADFDTLANTYINYNKPFTVTQGMTTYVYGVDFGLDFLTGNILWYVDDPGNPGNNLFSDVMPAANTAYEVSYWYFPDVLLRYLFRKLKPAHIRLDLFYIDTLGNPFIPNAGIWDLSNWDDSVYG